MYFTVPLPKICQSVLKKKKDNCEKQFEINSHSYQIYRWEFGRNKHQEGQNTMFLLQMELQLTEKEYKYMYQTSIHLYRMSSIQKIHGGSKPLASEDAVTPFQWIILKTFIRCCLSGRQLQD